MLDGQITIFEVSLPRIESKESKIQVISGVNAYIGQFCSNDSKIYSELEKESTAYINKNINGNVLELELCLKANKENTYCPFLARCISIRTDNGLILKINGFQNDFHDTKVNMNGDSVLSIGIFLTDEQYEDLINATNFAIEGAFALRKASNVYGFNVNVIRVHNCNQIEKANTYKLKRGQIQDFCG